MNEKVLIALRRMLCFILLIGGLASLLSSCVIQDEPTPPEKGPKVTVDFSLTLGGYNDDVVESRSLRSGDPVSDFIPVGNNVYLYATLEEERPVETRFLTTNLPPYALIQIVAYSGTTIMDSAKYVVHTDNSLRPYDNDKRLDVTAGTYRFVAYCLFNPDTGPTQSVPALSGTTISVGNLNTNQSDLMWGATDATITSSSTESVTITLNHLYSRIKVEASSIGILPVTGSAAGETVRIKQIRGARMNPSYGGAITLNVLTGTLTPASSSPDTSGLLLSRWRVKGTTTWVSSSSLDGQEVESDHYLIHTGGSSISTLALKIDTALVLWNGSADVNFGIYEFRFSKALTPGRSYTMKLDFKRLVWAGSNIHWDASRNRLYFYPDTTTVNSNRGIQGVYFMWGSLIGISPLGSFNNSTTKLYVPPVTQSTWTTQYAASPLDWSGTTLAQIPRLSSGTLIYSTELDAHSTRNYLAQEAHNPVNFQGDICKYLSDNAATYPIPAGEWRMPNAREFGAIASPASEYNLSTVGSYPGTILDDGKTNFYPIPAYVTRTMGTPTIFPAGGSRDAGGTLETTNTRYHSGSPISTVAPYTTLNASYNLYFTASAIHLNTPYHAPLGYQGLVRCVKTGVGVPIPFADLLITADLEDWTSGGTMGGTPGQGEVWY